MIVCLVSLEPWERELVFRPLGKGMNRSNDCLPGVSGTLGKGTFFQTFGKRYEQVK